MTADYDKVLSVISLPPDWRTDHDVTLLSAWFRKKSELFRDLSDAILFDLVKHCQFQRLHENDVIIKQGDQGDCFYILISGSVGIYVAHDDDPDGSPQLDEDSPREGVDRTASLGTYIRSLDSGKSFGEVALIDSANRRGASVVAEVASDLIVIDRTLYTRSLRAAQKRDLEERIEFVEKHPLFGKWKPKHKNYMAMGLSKKLYRYGNHIARQGDVIKKVHFILSGQALVSHDVTNNMIHDDDKSSPSSSRRGRRMHGPRQHGTRSRQTRPETDVEVCLIGQRGVIGDIEAVCGFTEHTHSIRAIEPVMTYEMELRSFNKLVMRRHAQTVQTLRALVMYKIENRKARLSDKQIPVYQRILAKLVTQEICHHHGRDVIAPVHMSPSRRGGRAISHERGHRPVSRVTPRDSRGKNTVASHNALRMGSSKSVPHGSRLNELLPGKRELSIQSGYSQNTFIQKYNSTSLPPAENTLEGSSLGRGGAGRSVDAGDTEEAQRVRNKHGDSKEPGKKITWVLPEIGVPHTMGTLLTDPSASGENLGKEATESKQSSERIPRARTKERPRSKREASRDQSSPSSLKLPSVSGRSTRTSSTSDPEEGVFVTERKQGVKTSLAYEGTGSSALSDEPHEGSPGSATGGDATPSLYQSQDESDIDEEVFGERQNSTRHQTEDGVYLDESTDGNALGKGDEGAVTSSPLTLKARRDNIGDANGSYGSLDQEDLRLLTYETYLTVRSEIKDFLNKVINDVRRYQDDHPAGVEPRPRAINPTLPRFLDERSEPIVTSAPVRGLRVGNASHVEAAAAHRPAVAGDRVVGARRGRSKSEGDTAHVTRSQPSGVTRKLTLPLPANARPHGKTPGHESPHQNTRPTPSTLALIYQQFGALKKAKPRRQYTQAEYKQLKDLLRLQQKRHVRYAVNL